MTGYPVLPAGESVSMETKKGKEKAARLRKVFFFFLKPKLKKIRLHFRIYGMPRD